MSSTKEYSSKINEMTKDTAEALLEIGLVFVDAKKNLNETEYEAFLQDTNYEKATSTVRKWERIGQAYLRLKTVSHSLPPVFTTLYKLSGLSVDELDVLIKNKILSPTVTTKEIDAELNPQSQSKSLPKLIICFNEDATEDFVNAVNDFLTSYASYLAVQANDEAQDLLI